jgi:hypothetical protein
MPFDLNGISSSDISMKVRSIITHKSDTNYTIKNLIKGTGFVLRSSNYEKLIPDSYTLFGEIDVELDPSDDTEYEHEKIFNTIFIGDSINDKINVYDGADR